MLSPELRLFFGTVSVTEATLGAFSILIYVFWYDKLLERWARMLRGVRRRNLGSEMQSHGAKEILIDVVDASSSAASSSRAQLSCTETLL